MKGIREADPGRASKAVGLLTEKVTRDGFLALIAAHHAITLHTPLADVVVACVCTPAVGRDASQWAEHFARAIASGATAPVGQAPVEEAGACRVIPIRKK